MRTSKRKKKFICLSDEISQKDLFDQFYSDFYALLEEFLEVVYSSGDTRNAREKVIDYLVDMYSQAFLEEVSYILNELAIPVTPQEIINIQNSVDTSSFVISNRGRLRDVLLAHEEKIKELKAETGLGREDFFELYRHNLVKLAVSEIHMSIEKASVQGGKLLQEVTNIKLYKMWNCVGDGRSCKTCLAMNGKEVPIDEPFIDTFTDIFVGLDYTGGDIPYAHPQCRCWLTYRQA